MQSWGTIYAWPKLQRSMLVVHAVLVNPIGGVVHVLAQQGRMLDIWVIGLPRSLMGVSNVLR